PPGPGPPTCRTPVTGGSGAQAPVALRGAAARAPALSVSQPSAGQLTALTPVTEREPTEPCRASRHSAGVAVADTSVQRRPGTPISTTWRTGPDGAGRASATPALSATATASATRAPPAASALVRIGCTRSTYPAGPPRPAVPPGPRPGAAPVQLAQ